MCGKKKKGKLAVRKFFDYLFISLEVQSLRASARPDITFETSLYAGFASCGGDNGGSRGTTGVSGTVLAISSPFSQPAPVPSSTSRANSAALVMMEDG